MSLPPSLRNRLRLPLIAAPMFLVSGPALVTAACRAGVVGSFPTANCRTVEELDVWLAAMTDDAKRAADANGRAPETDIRRTVVELSRTETESVARDAIRCGIEGVCKTVISSAHLTSFLITKLGDEADIKTTRTNSLLTKLGFRLLSRRKWRLDMRKIWIAGPDRDWSTIKSELDATVGKQFEVEEGEDE